MLQVRCIENSPPFASPSLLCVAQQNECLDDVLKTNGTLISFVNQHCLQNKRAEDEKFYDALKIFDYLLVIASQLFLVRKNISLFKAQNRQQQMLKMTNNEEIGTRFLSTRRQIPPPPPYEQLPSDPQAPPTRLILDSRCCHVDVDVRTAFLVHSIVTTLLLIPVMVLTVTSSSVGGLLVVPFNYCVLLLVAATWKSIPVLQTVKFVAALMTMIEVMMVCGVPVVVSFIDAKNRILTASDALLYMVVFEIPLIFCIAVHATQLRLVIQVLNVRKAEERARQLAASLPFYTSVYRIARQNGEENTSDKFTEEPSAPPLSEATSISTDLENEHLYKTCGLVKEDQMHAVWAVEVYYALNGTESRAGGTLITRRHVIFDSNSLNGWLSDKYQSVCTNDTRFVALGRSASVTVRWYLNRTSKSFVATPSKEMWFLNNCAMLDAREGLVLMELNESLPITPICLPYYGSIYLHDHAQFQVFGIRSGKRTARLEVVPCANYTTTYICQHGFDQNEKEFVGSSMSKRLLNRWITFAIFAGGKFVRMTDHLDSIDKLIGVKPIPPASTTSNRTQIGEREK
ncbi:unnamed protein product [Caenorhabditis sp. 36 PRJEB53466]|nr:unnamed protein product [Caenorhabditis sp. 36 PRJEB53466]